MQKNIALVRGDGIGPEIIEQALQVLRTVERRFGHSFTFSEVEMGGSAIEKYGDPLPEKMLEVCLGSDAVLLGAIGGPKWEGLPGNKRPEKGLLMLRKAMGLYANLRPVRIFPDLMGASPLRTDIVKDIDLMVVRELIGGVYFGEHSTREDGDQRIAKDVMEYSDDEIRRIMHAAFETAGKRRKKLTSVDKANVLDTSRLWREIGEEIAAEYPDIEYQNMLVDNAAMQLVKEPGQFDVIVTENMFGDILSDEASMLTGSIGMMPSASLGQGNSGLYEPIHGSAPDIAGQDAANPCGTILSVAMMLRYSFGLTAEAEAVERAVERTLSAGLRTPDIMNEAAILVGCKAMGARIAEEVSEIR